MLRYCLKYNLVTVFTRMRIAIPIFIYLLTIQAHGQQGVANNYDESKGKKLRHSLQKTKGPDHNIGLSNSYYVFSQTTDTYNDLVSPTVLTSVSGTWDDPEFRIPIGFTFEFFDYNVDSITISDYVWLIDTAWNYIDAFFADFVNRNPTTVVSPISYQVSGSPGARIFKVEWNNAGFYCELYDLGTTNDYVNVQLWLYESTNRVEVRIGPNSIQNTATAYCGETGAYIGLLNYVDTNLDVYYLAGSALNPTLGNNEEPVQGTPTEGTVYIFDHVIPPSVAENDKNLNIQVYPVPARESIYVDIIQPGPGVFSIKIQDLTGRLVINRLVDSGGNDTKTILVDNLSRGVYFLQVEHDGKISSSKKLVIE